MLVLPPPQDTTARRLRRKVRMLALRALLTLRPSATRRMTGDLAPIQAELLGLLRRNPEGLLEAAGSPDVLPSLLCLVSGAQPAPDCLRVAVPHLLAELSAQPDSLGGGLAWREPITRICVGGRRFEFEASARGLVASPSGMSVERSDGRHVCLSDLDSKSIGASLGLGRAVLASVDTNPLWDVEEHPGKTGNAIDLGGRDPSVWVGALREALALVALALPSLSGELETTLDRVVPVGYEPERHLSASYREAPGIVYLTLHPDPLVLAEALVHETQHGKLNLLSWLDPVLDNGRSEWAESPVRPDLRPLMGVLLAAHAFVPVAHLHRRLAELQHPVSTTPRFEERRRQVLATNTESIAIVEGLGRPTEVGQRILAALREAHDAEVDAYQR